jgi:hypothetical protein
MIGLNRQARRVNASGFPAVEKAKDVFKYVTAGDILRFSIEKDRKKVKAGEYVARVKTKTKTGFEVLINGARITISNMNHVVFIHRSDGYAYQF